MRSGGYQRQVEDWFSKEPVVHQELPSLYSFKKHGLDFQNVTLLVTYMSLFLGVGQKIS